VPGYLGNLPLQATGTISPSAFVSVSADHGVRQSSAAADIPVGISQVGFDRPPGLVQLLPGAVYTDIAAASGEELQIFFLGDVCGLRLGSGGCSANQLLTSDASGRGVVAAGGNYVGALAMQGGNVDDIIQVLVCLFKN
jgi:hypothetical protein